MESPAIISVRIEGVPHEYMAVEGIVEDMTHIVLNLKEALVKKTSYRMMSRARAIIKFVTKVIDIGGDLLKK